MEFESAGQSYLVCPALLALDSRHGEHNCGGRHPDLNKRKDHAGHTSNLFVWLPGCRPYTAEEWPHCDCGLALVYSDLDHPGAEHKPEACPHPGCADQRV